MSRQPGRKHTLVLALDRELFLDTKGKLSRRSQLKLLLGEPPDANAGQFDRLTENAGVVPRDRKGKFQVGNRISDTSEPLPGVVDQKILQTASRRAAGFVRKIRPSDYREEIVDVLPYQQSEISLATNPPGRPAIHRQRFMANGGTSLRNAFPGRTKIPGQKSSRKLNGNPRRQNDPQMSGDFFDNVWTEPGTFQGAHREKNIARAPGDAFPLEDQRFRVPGGNCRPRVCSSPTRRGALFSIGKQIESKAGRDRRAANEIPAPDGCVLARDQPDYQSASSSCDLFHGDRTAHHLHQRTNSGMNGNVCETCRPPISKRRLNAD